MKHKLKINLFINALVFLSIAPLFSMRGAIWMVSVTSFMFLINFRVLKDIKIKWDFMLLLPVLFFLILVAGLFYTSNFDRGIKIVERFFSFAILPVIFSFSSPLINANRYKIIKAYIYANAVFFIIVFLYAFYRQIDISLNKGLGINWYYFYRFDFLTVFKQHPTYVAMMTLLALTFLLFFQPELNFSKKKTLYLAVLFSLGILFSGSRQGYVQYFLIMTIYFIYQIKTSPYKQKYITGYIGSLLILVLIAVNIPIIKERILVTFGVDRYYKFYYRKHYSTAVNPEKQGRLLSWHDAWQLIKQKPVLGQGTGSDNDALIAQYKKNGHTYLFHKGYNAHNSYIQWWLSGGLILLIVWLSMLFAVFYRGIKTHDPVLGAFFIILFLTGFTETFYRVQGIIFIAYFYSFLLIIRKPQELSQ